jgi:hypothetical protein
VSETSNASILAEGPKSSARDIGHMLPNLCKYRRHTSDLIVYCDED